MGRGQSAGAERSGGGGSDRKMRAVGLRRYGPPEVLEPLEVERPEPGPDGVLIRVAAAGVNPADCLLRSGGLRFVARQEMPFVPGADVAGVVEAVGSDVTRFGVGDPVYAMLPSPAGGYAGYAAASVGSVAAIPPGLTFGEAAAVPLAALTALQALRDKAGLAAGARVLVNGASGGGGTFAVQVSRAIGARATAATSGRNTDLVRGLGADEVLDYTLEDVTAGKARYDAILDAANVLSFRKARRVLKPNGIFVTVNPFIGRLSPGWLARFRKGRRIESVLVRPSGSDLERIGAWNSAGEVKPVIDRTYPLADAEAAHRLSESRRARGKIVLVVDEKLAAEKAESALHKANRPMG